MTIVLNKPLEESLREWSNSRDVNGTGLWSLLRRLCQYIASGATDPSLVTLGFYQNGNYHASATVAVLSVNTTTGNPFEWTAYQSGVPEWISMEAGALYAATYGEKIPEIMARAIFTEQPFPKLHYRV